MMVRRTVVTSLGVLLLLSGCGGDTPTPAEAVPELADTLSSLDDALADRRYAKARRVLNTLVQTTVDAREAGELAPEQADRVLSAAARLLSALPAPRRPGDEEPGQEATEAPAPEESEDDWEKEQEELQKELEEEQKKLEQEQKKLEEKAEKAEKAEKDDEGDGRNSGNGPDDGHGN